MLMKPEGLGTVASQWSNDREFVALATANVFLCGEWEEKGKRLHVLFFPVDPVWSTPDRAGGRFFWVPTKSAAQRPRNSVKRSWMPEEAIISDQMEKLCLSTLKTKLQVRNDQWQDVFKEQKAADVREKI